MRSAVNTNTRQMPTAARGDIGEASQLSDRRRNLASFLTWAFFLAEAAGRDVFLPSAAHAAEDDPRSTSHGSGDGSSIVSALPNADLLPTPDVPGSMEKPQAAPMPHITATDFASTLAEAKYGLADDSSTQGTHGGGGGGSGFMVAENASSNAIPADPHHLAFDIDQPDLGTSNLLHLNGQALQLGAAGVNVDLGLVSNISDILDSAGHELGTTADALLDAARPALSPAASIIGLVGDGISSAHAAPAVGSSGQLHFARGSSPPPDDLMSDSAHTDFGITLHLGPAEPSTHSADASAQANAGDFALLDATPFDSHTGNGLSDHLSDALDVDQALLRLAGDTLG
jgi:hypothetical protein